MRSAVASIVSGVATRYFATSSHEMSKYTWLSSGFVSARSTIAELVLDRAHDAPEADVRPDDRGLRVPLEEVPQLDELIRLLLRLRERHVDVVVQEHDESDLAGEIEDPVERRIREAGRLAGDLGRDELLVDRELADAREHAGKGRAARAGCDPPRTCRRD